MFAINAKLKMQMRAGCPPRGAHFANGLTLRDRLSAFNQHLTQMRVNRGMAVVVFHHDCFAIAT